MIWLKMLLSGHLMIASWHLEVIRHAWTTIGYRPLYGFYGPSIPAWHFGFVTVQWWNDPK